VWVVSQALHEELLVVVDPRVVVRKCEPDPEQILRRGRAFLDLCFQDPGHSQAPVSSIHVTLLGYLSAKQ